VGDDENAVQAAREAFTASADPARLPAVRLATRVPIALALTVVHDPRRDPKDVDAAVRTALLDADDGLLGERVLRIGQAIYDSAIDARCLAAPGVIAVHDLELVLDAPSSISRAPLLAARWQARWLRPRPLQPRAPVGILRRRPAGCAEARHDPGEGGYLFAIDDPLHFSLTLQAGA
jgi:hypothetical protein